MLQISAGPRAPVFPGVGAPPAHDHDEKFDSALHWSQAAPPATPFETSQATRVLSKSAPAPGIGRITSGERKQGNRMPDMTIVYWRDIPAQVIVGKGRRAEKRVLPERFEQAIDRCAMAVGARDSDAYLAEWRRGAPVQVEGDAAEIAASAAARLDAEYDPARLTALIAASGWEPA